MEWGKIYEKMFGGFDDLDEEEEESGEDESEYDSDESYIASELEEEKYVDTDED